MLFRIKIVILEIKKLQIVEGTEKRHEKVIKLIILLFTCDFEIQRMFSDNLQSSGATVETANIWKNE